MPSKKNAPDEPSHQAVSENDVVFDCPECKKLLVVDGRASGLKINCPLCDKPISVPQQSHVTQGIEHHDPATLEEKRGLFQKQIDENRMQHTQHPTHLWHHTRSVRILQQG